MALNFDPASILAPGGIVSGLDDLGAAVTNAMNRRSERKAAQEAEAARRRAALEDRADTRKYGEERYGKELADKRADEQGKRDYESGEKDKDRKSREGISREKARVGLIGKIMQIRHGKASAAAGLSKDEMAGIYVKAGLTASGVNYVKDPLGIKAMSAGAWTPQQQATFTAELNKARAAKGLGAASSDVTATVQGAITDGLDDELAGYDISLDEIDGAPAAAPAPRAASSPQPAPGAAPVPTDPGLEAVKAKRIAEIREMAGADPAKVAKARTLIATIEAVKSQDELTAFESKFSRAAAPAPVSAVPPPTDLNGMGGQAEMEPGMMSMDEIQMRGEAAKLAQAFQSEVGAMPQLPPNRHVPGPPLPGSNEYLFNEAATAEPPMFPYSSERAAQLQMPGIPDPGAMPPRTPGPPRPAQPGSNEYLFNQQAAAAEAALAGGPPVPGMGAPGAYDPQFDRSVMVPPAPGTPYQTRPQPPLAAGQPSMVEALRQAEERRKRAALVQMMTGQPQPVAGGIPVPP